MKKFVFIFLSLLIIACSSDKSTDQDTIREQAKRDVIEKLDLPQGTKFTDDSVEITTDPNNGEGPNVTYLVKITVKSQDNTGKDINKVYKMHYKKRADAESAAERFELTDFQ